MTGSPVGPSPPGRRVRAPLANSRLPLASGMQMRTTRVSASPSGLQPHCFDRLPLATKPSLGAAGSKHSAASLSLCGTDLLLLLIGHV
eukprot:scaffold1839_cov382-Prasinococcus_capsulatus_cf.AAC.37